MYGIRQKIKEDWAQMKIRKWILITVLIITNTITLTGCWNYREIESLAIVSGVAIDKTEDNKCLVTVEIVEIEGQKQAKISPKIISMSGETIFDAVRNIISFSGKKLYWSHAKIAILSQDVSKEGIVKIIDWINRDSETRSTIKIIVSKENTAKEILSGKNKTNEIVAFGIDEVLRNEISLSKTVEVDVWKFIDDLERSGISPVTPAISIKNDNGQMTPQISGSAVFQNDRLLGFLNGEDTKHLLFIKDKIKGGLLINELQNKGENVKVSLEIFKNKTKITPIKNGNVIEINIDTKTDVALDELGGSADYISDSGNKKLKAAAEENLKNNIENLIKRVQNEYGVDIFGFGSKVKEEMPDKWRKVEGNWNEIFKTLQVNVNCQINIKNSAMMSKPIEIGD